MKVRKKRLTTARHCRQYLQDLVYRLDCKEIEVDRARAICYAVSLIIKSIEVDEIERRVTELEKLMGDKNHDA